MKTNTIELARDVAGVEYSYYEAPMGWERLTRDRTKPSALIRVTLWLEDGRNWTPFVAAPMVELVPAVTN